MQNEQGAGKSFVQEPRLTTASGASAGMDIGQLHLDQDVERELHSLLARSRHNPPVLEDVWELMDRVWDELGCDNKELDFDRINRFYLHPVWLLNDLFIARDPTSMQHRHAISNWIATRRGEIGRVLDYGGGFGALACLLNDQAPGMHIDIYEPFPSQYALAKVGARADIRFVDAPAADYDCLVSVDVLEHVPDPIDLLTKMAGCVRKDGYLVIANCFAPVIKCHLPRTFHLRYTFGMFAAVLGLESLGPCEGSHAQLYRKSASRSPHPGMIKALLWLSRAAFPPLNLAAGAYQAIKRSVK